MFNIALYGTMAFLVVWTLGRAIDGRVVHEVVRWLCGAASVLLYPLVLAAARRAANLDQMYAQSGSSGIISASNFPRAMSMFAVVIIVLFVVLAGKIGQYASVVALATIGSSLVITVVSASSVTPETMRLILVIVIGICAVFTIGMARRHGPSEDSIQDLESQEKQIRSPEE